MEIEHLQMIIDAMKDATEGAFWLAVMWIGKSYGSGLAWLLVAVIAALTTRVVVKTLSDGAVEKSRNKDERAKEKSDCAQAFASMRREDPEYKKDGFHSDYIMDHDLQRIRSIFAEGCVAIKERKEGAT